MNYDSRGGVSAAFSYPRAKASTSFPAVLNLLKCSKFIEYNVETDTSVRDVIFGACPLSEIHALSRASFVVSLSCFTSGNKVSRSLFAFGVCPYHRLLTSVLSALRVANCLATNLPVRCY